MRRHIIEAMQGLVDEDEEEEAAENEDEDEDEEDIEGPDVLGELLGLDSEEEGEDEEEE